jgi:hypothetical protein
MSLLDCINNAEKEGPDNGGLTKEQAQKARKLFQEFESKNSKDMNMGPDEANAQAARDTFDVLEREAQQNKKRMILQRAAQNRILKNIESYQGKNIGEAIVSHLERDGRGNTPWSNVMGRAAVIRGMAHAKMADVIEKLRKTKILGRTTRKARAKSINMVREIFGEATEDASAKSLAAAWKETAEFLRIKFNQAGGDIPKRSDWGMPQVHDSTAVRLAGAKAWKEFILPLLDVEKMVSFRTGKPMSEAEFDEVLSEIWETISTEGWSKISETSVAGQGKSLSKRRQDHRFLVFRDADSFMKYDESFGSGDIFDLMMSHIDGMSKDIAMLQILGPNPTSTVRVMQNKVRKMAAQTDAKNKNSKATNALARKIKQFDDMYNYITGKTNQPANEFLARSFAGLGNFLTSAQLGSVSLLAITTDPNYTRITKRMAGMSQLKSAVFASLKMLTANKTTKKQAIRMGLIAEHWSAAAYGQARFTAEFMGGKVSEMISNAVLNASLLSPFTQAGRWAFGMEFMGFIADNAKVPYAKLNDAFKDTLGRYGITESDWAKMPSFKQYDFKGSKFLRPDDMLATESDLAYKVLDMIQDQTNYAVPVASVRARTTLIGSSQPGSYTGIMSRSFAMYKSFPVTFMQRNIMAAITQKGAPRKASIAGDLLISSTILAALGMQMREVAKGRDPRDMTDERFWGSAMLSSGGLGIWGDFLFSGRNRFGGGLTETIAGPQFGFLNDLANLTIGNVFELAMRKETNFGKESVNFFGRYLPGNSLWYARLGFERSVLDRLREWADPEASQKFREIERKRQREYGQEYFWRPGELTPERSPNIQAVTGD